MEKPPCFIRGHQEQKGNIMFKICLWYVWDDGSRSLVDMYQNFETEEEADIARQEYWFPVKGREETSIEEY